MANVLPINSDYRRSLLEALELFHGVEPDDVHELLERCERRDFEPGEVLLSPGVHNEHVFIVLSGMLTVHIGSQETEAIASIDVGACVGEMSIIEDRDPSAYVVASEQSHLLVMHQSVLWDMVNASHEFAKNLLIVLSERVRSHNRVIAESFGELRRYERNATTDALTGLGNRHAMEEAFPREIERCEEGELPISLIMIDVDNFKVFNDHFGHIAGDRALCAVSEVLRSQFRPHDLVVRYGGDEFAVLLPGVDEKLAVTIADRVRAAVGGETEDSDDSLIQIPIRISMGVTAVTGSVTLDGLIRSADAALYRAKAAGRNTVST